MASFDIAYHKYILPNEGGYANVVGDKGGETYAGIARNFHPSWGGWDYIDFQKKTKGTIRNNTKFPAIQYLVDDFYKKWWNDKLFSQIVNQDVANIFFDFNVNSSTTAIKAIQKMVGTTADGIMGPKTIAAINSQDPAMLYNKIKEYRKSFYHWLVEKDPTQEKFLTGWLIRLNSFPDLKTTGATLGVIALLVMFFF